MTHYHMIICLRGMTDKDIEDLKKQLYDNFPVIYDTEEEKK